MMTNQFILQQFDTGDPARLGAQVITGVGFLGVGTILVTGRHKIKGLTTAPGFGLLPAWVLPSESGFIPALSWLL